MIRLGINTMVWSGGYDGRQLELFGPIRELGFETVELAIFDFAPVAAAPIRKALAATGLALTVSTVLPDGLSLLSGDAAVRLSTREWLRTAMEKTAEIGGTVLAGPVYNPVGDLPGRRRTMDEWNRAVEEYRALGDAVRGTGVLLAIEPLNRFETYFLNTAADARRLADEIDRDSIGVLYDTFHANIEEQHPVEALAALGPRLAHVHLSENDRGVPGCGHVPFAETLRALTGMGYEGNAVVESFAAFIPEVARATAIWRDFADSPDDFARRSAANLRPLLGL